MFLCVVHRRGRMFGTFDTSAGSVSMIHVRVAILDARLVVR